MKEKPTFSKAPESNKRPRRSWFTEKPYLYLKKVGAVMTYEDFKNWTRAKMISLDDGPRVSKVIAAINHFQKYRNKSDSSRIHNDLSTYESHHESFKSHLSNNVESITQPKTVIAVLAELKYAVKLYQDYESIDKVLAKGCFVEALVYQMKRTVKQKKILAEKADISLGTLSRWLAPTVDPHAKSYKPSDVTINYKRRLPFSDDIAVQKVEKTLGLDQGELANLCPRNYRYSDEVTKVGTKSFTPYSIKLEELEQKNPYLADLFLLYCEYRTVSSDRLHSVYNRTYCPITKRLKENPKPPKDQFGFVKMGRKKQRGQWKTKLSVSASRAKFLDTVQGYIGFLISPIVEEIIDGKGRKNVSGLGLKLEEITVLEVFNQENFIKYSAFLIARGYNSADEIAEFEKDSFATAGFQSYAFTLIEMINPEQGFLRQRRDLISDDIAPLYPNEIEVPAGVMDNVVVYKKELKESPCNAEQWATHCDRLHELLLDIIKSRSNKLDGVRNKFDKLETILEHEKPLHIALEIVENLNEQIRIYNDNNCFCLALLELYRERMCIAFTATFSIRAGSTITTKLSHDFNLFGQGSDFSKDKNGEVWLELPGSRQKNNRTVAAKVNSLFNLTTYIEEYIQYAKPYFDDRNRIRSNERKRHLFRFLSENEDLSNELNKDVALRDETKLKTLLENQNHVDASYLSSINRIISSHFSEFKVPVSTHDYRTIATEQLKKYLFDKGMSMDFLAEAAARQIADSKETTKEHYMRDIGQDLTDRIHSELKHWYYNIRPTELAKKEEKTQKSREKKNTSKPKTGVVNFEKVNFFFNKYSRELLFTYTDDRIMSLLALEGITGSEADEVLATVRIARKANKDPIN